MERMSLVFQNSKFYNTMTILRSLSLKHSPWWNLTHIDLIQIGLESRLYFFSFLNQKFNNFFKKSHLGQPANKELQS